MTVVKTAAQYCLHLFGLWFSSRKKQLQKPSLHYTPFDSCKISIDVAFSAGLPFHALGLSRHQSDGQYSGGRRLARPRHLCLSLTQDRATLWCVTASSAYDCQKESMAGSSYSCTLQKCAQQDAKK